MNALYILAPATIDDLADIQAHVEERRGEELAVQVVDELFEAFAKLGRQPGLGHRRRDLTPSDVFFWTALRQYALIYRKASRIEIVRVIPWRRMEPFRLGPLDGEPS